MSLQVSKANVVLSKYLTDHEVVDVLREFPSHSCAPKLFISLLKPLQPRYYSIASSPTQVCICQSIRINMFIIQVKVIIITMV